MVSKSLQIEGMTCASCAQTVERVTKKLDGVKEANVNLATEKLSISYDESILSVDDIQSAVKKAGYKAISDNVSTTMSIEGMTCSSCVQAIERALNKLDGVVEANVNLATEKLFISYDSSTLKVSDIKKAIEKAGYRAVEEDTTVDIDQEKKEKEIKIIWNKFIVSAGSVK